MLRRIKPFAEVKMIGQNLLFQIKTDLLLILINIGSVLLNSFRFPENKLKTLSLSCDYHITWDYSVDLPSKDYSSQLFVLEYLRLHIQTYQAAFCISLRKPDL